MDENDNETKLIELEKAQDTAEAEVAQTTPEEPSVDVQAALSGPRCPFCQSFLFLPEKPGVNTYNIQMGLERLRVFTCATCHCVLPMQVMLIDTPMIAQPGPQGGRLIRH